VPFSISSWLLRKRIDAHVRQSGRPMEHRRVVNPYHAVSIEPGSKCCQDARKLEGHRFLAAAAPKLPLRGCGATAFECRNKQQHHRHVTRNSAEQSPIRQVARNAIAGALRARFVEELSQCTEE